MKYCLLLTLLFVLTLLPESGQAEEKKSDWQNLISLGFSLAKGNTDSMLFNGSFKSDRKREESVFLAELTGSYGETDDEKSAQNLTANSEYKHFIKENTFLSMGLKLFHDDIAEIDYRLALNPAIGNYLIRSKETSLSVEVGPSYIFERVDGIDNNYLAPRIADRLEMVLTDTAKFYQFAEVLIAAEDSDNVKATAEVGFDLAINAHLSLTLTVKDKYDNTPAEGADRNDIEYITALTSRF